MALPPSFGATGLDGSDPATLVAHSMMAPSAMGAPEIMRKAYSDEALDGPNGYGTEGTMLDMDPSSKSYGDTNTLGLQSDKALSLLKDASSQSGSFFQASVHAPWERSYRAVRNEHYRDSIYTSKAYDYRSKLFKPKTRSALWKRLATTTKALFTTSDVVSVQAEDDSNPQEVVSASLKQEVLNYRLRSQSNRVAIPWLMTAIGARYDADVTGICCSKQSWIFKEKSGGAPGITKMGRSNVLVDRPDVQLFAPENVRFDPNANWINVAQHSSYVLLYHAMTPDDAMDMIRNSSKTKIPWKSDITEEYFRSHSGSDPSETQGPRGARQGNSDPQQQASGAYRNVWLTEVFMRFQGVDYTFWALEDTKLLSDPIETEEVYPHLSGERPVAIGTSQIEPHKAYVMSAVESWQPLQQESNDLTNLRLDYEKRIVAPPNKVKRGQKVDLQGLQRKGPNGTILVNDMNDIMPMEMPEIPGSVFNEQQLLNADFDDLSGNFNAASVQTSRSMNETVGGMHLLAESGNQIADFDLTIWNETWVTPVMAQLLKLVEYYETDQNILMLCGERAQLWQKFGVSEITDEMLRNESTVRINIGVGATSLPMQKIKNFDAAWDTAAKALAPFVQSGKIDIVPNAEAIVDDIFQAASFRDGGKRYFEYVGPPQQQAQPPVDPKAEAQKAQAQAKMQSNQIQQEKNQADSMMEAHKLNDQRTSQHLTIANDQAQRQSDLMRERIRAMTEIAKTRASMAHQSTMQGMDHAHEHGMAHSTPFLQQLAQHLAPQKPAAGGKGGGDDDKANRTPRGDPNRPMLAPLPSPKYQPQPAMYANLSTAPSQNPGLK